MAERELTGIQRAVAVMGTQAKLAAAMTEKGGKTVNQAQVSVWVNKGWAPQARAELIADITGVMVFDLLRKPKTRAAHDR